MRAIRSQDGIVLILISAILTCLLGLAAFVLSATRMLALRSEAGREQAKAALCADSGMQYAAARLTERQMPGAGAVEGRGDDWTFRDSPYAEAAGARNPSYSHGEAWTDLECTDAADGDGDGTVDEPDEGDGIAGPADAAGPDRDKDGKPSAWTGRLRGARGAYALRFSLRIDAAEGKIPLNAGRFANPGPFDGLDNDDDNTADEAGTFFTPAECEQGTSSSPRIPEHRDDKIPYHLSLARVIDHLGIETGVTTRRGAHATTGEPLEVCWIGTDLIRNRPPDGYRSWEQVKETLLALPASPYDADPYTALDYAGALYTAEDVERIRPFLDLGPYEPMPGSSRCAYNGGEYPPDYVPIALAAAPRAVLKSVWMHLATHNPRSAFLKPQWKEEFPAEDAGWNQISTQTGLDFGSSILLIFPGEADRLAREAISFRRQGSPSGQSLREWMIGRADEIFERDFADIGAGFPYLRWSWAAAKASLACEAVSADPAPSYTQTPLLRWGGRGIDANPDVGGFQQVPVCRWDWSNGAEGVPCFYPVNRPSRFDPALPPVGSTPYGSVTTGVRPQGFTLAPPVLFQISAFASAGALTASRQGRLRAVERLELASQEDFEGLWEEAAAARGWRTPLTRKEISVLPDLAAADRFDCQGAGGYDPLVVSVPRWGWRGIGRTIDPPAPLTSNKYPQNVLAAPFHGFSMGPGGVSLAAARNLPPDGARMLWGFRPDFVAENRSVPGVEHRELTSWCDPAYYKGPDPPLPFAAYGLRHLYPAMPAASGFPMEIEPAGTTGPHAIQGDSTALLPGLHSVDELYRRYPAWTGGALRTSHPGVRDFAWNGWFGPSAKSSFSDTVGVHLGVVGGGITVEAKRGFDGGDPAKPGTLFTLRVAGQSHFLHWTSTLNPWSWAAGNPLAGNPSLYPGFGSPKSRFVPDATSPPDGWHFVHLRSWGSFEDGTRWCSEFTNTLDPATLADRAWIQHFELYVDDNSAPLATIDFWDPAQADVKFRTGRLIVSGAGSLTVRGVDDLRFFDFAAPCPAPPYADRFERVGTFRSPRYLPEGGASLKQAAWEGIFPHGAADQVEAFLEGYDRTGTKVADIQIGPSGVSSDVQALGFPARVASFRYRVRFNSIAAPSPMMEAPVFESIWLTLQRPGFSPAWLAYE